VTDQFVIITPELRAGTGGVADHTSQLLEHWKPRQRPTILVARVSDMESGQHGVSQLGSDRAAILRQLPGNGGKVFVQYSAYGYDRLGYPKNLLGALVEWKQQVGGRLIVMFHEIWTFWPIINRNFLRQRFHRRAIKRLMAVSDVAFTSTGSQAEHLQSLQAGASIRVLPVGSNIHRNSGRNIERRPRWAVLFGLQQTRLRALQTMVKSLQALAAAGQVTKIVSLGHGSNPQMSERERKLLEDLKLADGFDQLGPGTEEEISEMLSTASFGIFGQNELSCGKSGSFMAYAMHGLKVLAEFASPAKAAPVCYLVAPHELLGGISSDEIDRRANSLQTWQKQNSSWDLIAGKLADALKIDAPRSGTTV
jgi:hypothetical protein